MTLVRFAYICDLCGVNMDWMAECAKCGDDVCPDCARTAIDESVLCKRCSDKQFEDQDYKRDAAEDAERAMPRREP